MPSNAATDHDADAPSERVSAFWAKAAAPDFRLQLHQVSWFGHPEVKRYVNRMTTGDPGRWWLDHAQETYLSAPRPKACVTLGCGEGALERLLIGRNFADSYVGYDISAACIDQANATVGHEHPSAEFHCADLNFIELPKNTFDVAFFSHALHHIERLEHLCDQVRASLRPNGILLVDEFIGPTRMQWTPQQLAVCNQLLAQLPEYLRIDLSRLPERRPKEPITRMSIAEWLRCDPSECVRSADIPAVLETYFETIERHDYGGTILQKLLENIVGNFLPDNEEHATIIRMLVAIEEILISTGVLSSDFTIMIMRPRLR